MENVLYFNDLYDLYGELLTEKQKKYFEDYYFNNFSFSEMALNYNVSRNAICKQLHSVKNKLEEYEDKLGIYKKKSIVKKLMSEVTDDKIKRQLEKLF